MTERQDDLQELDASLSQLKQRVRRYIVLEGLAIVVAVLGIGFWISFGGAFGIAASRSASAARADCSISATR